MRKVFEYCRENKIKIGVLSSASRALIEKALEHFGLPCDAVVGFQLYIGMPDAILGNRLMTKLNVREDQIVHIGASEVAETQARCSKFDFYGAACHNPANEPFTAKGVKVLGSPLDIIGVL
jgi:phosphoglycolate phosphatase-like HAD superfamily hydrolase